MKRYHPSNEPSPPTTSANLAIITTDSSSSLPKSIRIHQRSNFKKDNSVPLEIASTPNNPLPSLTLPSSHSTNTAPPVVEISTGDSPLVTSTDVTDTVDMIQLRQERNNQSSPIPTKNVVSGGGSKISSVLNRPHYTTAPIIGLVNLTDTKEDWGSAVPGGVSIPTNSIQRGSGKQLAALEEKPSAIPVQTTIFNNQVTFSRAGENPPTTSSTAHVLKLATAKDAVFSNTQIRNNANIARIQLAKNVFNTISPPNKTVTDALETFSDTSPVPLEEPSVWGPSLHGTSSELDDVVDAVISNTTESLQFE